MEKYILWQQVTWNHNAACHDLVLIRTVFGIPPLGAKLIHPVVIERSLPLGQQLLLFSMVFQHL